MILKAEGSKITTFDDCITVVFNGTIDPTFTKTQAELCDFVLDKSEQMKNGNIGTNDDLVQELENRLGDVLKQEVIDSFKLNLTPNN